MQFLPEMETKTFGEIKLFEEFNYGVNDICIKLPQHNNFNCVSKTEETYYRLAANQIISEKTKIVKGGSLTSGQLFKFPNSHILYIISDPSVESTYYNYARWFIPVGEKNAIKRELDREIDVIPYKIVD